MTTPSAVREYAWKTVWSGYAAPGSLVVSVVPSPQSQVYDTGVATMVTTSPPMVVVRVWESPEV